MHKIFVRFIILFLGAQAVAMAGSLEWAPPGPYPSANTCQPVRFDQPDAVAIDRTGDIYIANASGPNAVQEVTVGKGTIRTLLNRRLEPIKSGQYFGFSLAVGPRGDLFVAVQNRGTIERVNADGTLTVVAGKAGDRRLVDGSSSVARLRAPNAIAIDPRGVIYVADTRTIRKITSDGSVLTLAGSLYSKRPRHSASTVPYFKDGRESRAVFLSANAIAVDAFGNVYVADSYDGRVDGQLIDLGLLREVTAAGLVRTIAGTLDYNGTDFDGVGAKASFSHLSGVAISADGNLYVTEPISGSVRKISSRGVVTTIWTQSSVSSTGLIAPTGVAIGSGNGIFVVDDFATVATTEETPYWLHRIVNGDLQTLCRNSRR